MLLPSVMNIVMELLRPPETGLLTIVTNLEIERQSPSFLPRQVFTVTSVGAGAMMLM